MREDASVSGDHEALDYCRDAQDDVSTLAILVRVTALPPGNLSQYVQLTSP